MNVQLNTATTAKKQAIYESTLRLIREFGFHGTPMSQIAQEAGVATGTIYHYFDSKDELIVDLYHYVRERMQQEIFEGNDHKRSYPERFAAVWMNLVKYYIQHPQVLSFLEQFFSSPYVKDVYPEDRVCFQDEVSVFLKQGIQEGYIKPLDINIISAAYIGTVSATAKRNIHGRFALKEEDFKKMVAIIWDGIKN
ncbi:TetR/AcrR family transcriptional regulator [Parapedobacter sp. 2B3]|uniref:TetR/AcrR family transcriptional regulator n=1 Tax=Parapedobacter sp. 2B3 TaxID=3342381 RepID=UPI0035B572C1